MGLRGEWDTTMATWPSSRPPAARWALRVNALGVTRKGNAHGSEHHHPVGNGLGVHVGSCTGGIGQGRCGLRRAAALLRQRAETEELHAASCMCGQGSGSSTQGLWPEAVNLGEFPCRETIISLQFYSQAEPWRPSGLRGRPAPAVGQSGMLCRWLAAVSQSRCLARPTLLGGHSCRRAHPELRRELL